MDLGHCGGVIVGVELGLRPYKNWFMLSLKFPRQKIVKGDFLKRYGDFRAWLSGEGRISEPIAHQFHHTHQTEKWKIYYMGYGCKILSLLFWILYPTSTVSLTNQDPRGCLACTVVNCHHGIVIIVSHSPVRTSTTSTFCVYQR